MERLLLLLVLIFTKVSKKEILKKIIIVKFIYSKSIDLASYVYKIIGMGE